MTNKNKAKEPETKKSVAKDWAVSIIVTIAIAFAIKYFIADIYSIPTGSMEPLLHGVEHSGDRVLCTKFNYYLRDEFSPRRWEIFVFKYPGKGRHEGENYIKRCVGLPDESMYIIDGDIYIKKPHDNIAKIATKPFDLQESIWIPVYSENFDKNNEEAFEYNWRTINNSGKWTLDSGRLHGNTNSAIHLKYRPMSDGYEHKGIPDRHIKRQVVTFECPKCHTKLRKTVHTQQLTTICKKCGKFMSEENILPDSFKYPGSESNSGPIVRISSFYHIVSDLNTEFDLQVESKRGMLILELFSENDSYKAKIPLTEGKVFFMKNGEKVAESEKTVNLIEKQVYHMKFYRYDGMAGLFINNEKIAEYDMNLARRRRILQADRSGFALSLENGNVFIDNISLDRDIHYFPFYEKRHIEIPENSFFALGDNSPTSNDSRGWGFVPRANLIGPAILVWWPLHRIKLLK